MSATTIDYAQMINDLYPGMGSKTPISLMNEVAKAHNLQAEYQVTEESGPDHKKSFKVSLALGDSRAFEGTGKSIKSAQHNAAFVGLQKCGLSLPPRKNNPNPSSMTPCVELNGIAMKLGHPTQYTDLPPKTPIGAGFPNNGMGPGYHNGGMVRGYPHNRGGYQRHFSPRIFCVSLKVGNREFYGEGRHRQEAKHKAATKALEILRVELQEKEKANEEIGKPEDKENTVVVTSKLPEGDGNSSQPSGKSEISQVYEIATSRKFQVVFEVVKESGPPHMKNYVTKVSVQDKAGESKYVAEGEGASKKISRQKAAAKVLEELKTLPALQENLKPNKGRARMRPNNRNATKKPKPKAELDLSLNPVSLLGQIMQQRHESLPVYTCTQDRGIQRNKDFIIKVTIDKHSAEGSGMTKKVAKRNAAEKMLHVLGIKSGDAENAQSGEGTLSLENTADSTPGGNGNSSNRKVTFNDQITGTNKDGQPTLLGRQLAPGLLPMLPEMAKASSDVVAPISQGRHIHQQQKPSLHGGLNRAPGAPVGPTLTLSSGLSPVQKLLNLAEVEGFQVQFTDYPKESPNNPGVQEFLTLVTISSVPPMVCHGSGSSVQESREHAAENALKPLMSLGLDRGGTLRVLEEEKAKQGKGGDELKVNEENAHNKSDTVKA